MDVTQEDVIQLMNISGGGGINLDLETAYSLRDKLDHLIQRLESSESDDIACTSGRGSRGMKRIDMEGPSTCDHWCAHHAVLMNPNLWSTLPKELLYCVFARLPLSQIIRLRCVSKEWMRNVMSAEEDSGGFRGVCTESNPKMFGVIYQTLREDDNMFGIAVCDVRSNEWYKFAIETPYTEHNFITMCASDGGLVCIMSRVKDESFKGPLLIIVCNPLTRQWKALPPHSLSPVQPLMVQLVMDRDTKGYEVIVVYCKNDRHEESDVKAKVYNSATGEWRSAKSNSNTTFLGYQYVWEFDDSDLLAFFRYFPSVYDCGDFKTLDPTPILVRGAAVRGHVLVEDRLFVLHQDMGAEGDRLGEVGHQKRYFISEYRGQKCEPNWVGVKDHSVTDLKYCLHRDHFDLAELYGCKGFLLVNFFCDFCGLAQVYDLSTGKWHVIAHMPDVPDGPIVWTGGMCELQWEAVP